MQEIPLFPLQTVLFPGALLRLHIFEERYKQMINFCIEKEQPFGVVLIRHGVEALGPLAEPYLVGTLAKIIQVEQLPDERMNIAAIGQERFQILSLEPDLESYLIGYVKPLLLLEHDQAYIDQKALRLHSQVERYFQALSEAGMGQFDMAQFPNDPVGFAYLSASLLQIANEQKQAILAAERAETLLAEVAKAYSRETALLKSFITRDLQGHDIFSRN